MKSSNEPINYPVLSSSSQNKGIDGGEAGVSLGRRQFTAAMGLEHTPPAYHNAWLHLVIYKLLLLWNCSLMEFVL